LAGHRSRSRNGSSSTGADKARGFCKPPLMPGSSFILFRFGQERAASSGNLKTENRRRGFVRSASPSANAGARLMTKIFLTYTRKIKMKNAASFYIGLGKFEDLLQITAREELAGARLYFSTRSTFSHFERSISVLVTGVAGGVCFYWLLEVENIQTLTIDHGAAAFNTAREHALNLITFLRAQAEEKGFRTAEGSVAMPTDLRLMYGTTALLPFREHKPLLPGNDSEPKEVTSEANN
jgi:hypothetical protein